LSVRVGTAWSPYDEGSEPEAPADATGTAQPRAERAQGALTAGRKEILEGPSGLDGILESGEFQVRGTVYFRPLQPFDPKPKIPETDAQGNLVGDAQNRFYASEPIGGEKGYRYPQDHGSGSRRGGGTQ
jgi:hypothetical protein